RNQCNAGCEFFRLRIGINADLVCITIVLCACQYILECGLRKNFLQADDISIQPVELLCNPPCLGFVFRFGIGRLIGVKCHPRQGKVADIEGREAEFLLHNVLLFDSSVTRWQEKSMSPRHLRRSGCVVTRWCSRGILTNTKSMAVRKDHRVRWVLMSIS